ncbi:MAG: hypothetical protein C0599_04450 [Salinivirgaceae bacterium]|nr:MAG: hypothetical protein C0599_04450 [Salinivirgaceae bacterium]
MNNFYKITVTTLLICSFLAANAQYKITTLKGDILRTTEIKIVEDNSFKELIYLNTYGKEKYLDYESIFSIDEKGKKSIVYKPQDEFDLNVKRMQQMVNGRIAGKDAGCFWGAFLTSFALTSASGFVDITNQGQLFFTPLIPAVATIGIGLYGWKSKVKHDNRDEDFTTGYREQRAYRMIKASLLGGAAGLGVAATAYSIRHN